VTFGGENFGIINFDTRRHLVVKRAISLYLEQVTTKKKFRNFFSVFPYVINLQEISEQPTLYFF
jgi:hypothetical protein